MRKALIALVLLLSGFALADTPVATDNFTRADLGNLGANWTDPRLGWKIATNTAATNGTTGGIPATFTGASFSVDQYSTIKTRAWRAGGPGALVRAGGTNNATYYGVRCQTISGSNCTAVGLFKSGTQLGSNYSVTITPTDSLTLKVSGSTLSMWKNTTQIGTDVTDATIATGNPGITSTASLSSIQGLTYWEGGNVGNTAATPTADPVAGTYTAIQSVSLSTSTGTGVVHYTLDNSAPSCASSTYSTPLNITTTTTVKAIACASGYSDSSIATFLYTINIAATPGISPAAGAYFAQQSVTLTCGTASPSIYYTTDGSTPNTGSTLYTGAFNGAASGSQTIKAICTASGYGTSPVATASYTIAPADVPISSDNFGAYYDADLGGDKSQQRPLDTDYTAGNWKHVGPLTGNATPEGTNPELSGAAHTTVTLGTCTPVLSGKCVGAYNQSLHLTAFTGRTGFSPNQFSKAYAPASSINPVPNTGAGVGVRCATDGSKTGYYFLVSPGAGARGAHLFKILNGAITTLAATVTATIPDGSTVELRVLGTSMLQPLVNGAAVSGLPAVYTDSASPIAGGVPCIASSLAFISDWSSGNVGDADATAPVSYTPAYTTHSDTFTSGWTQVWPWIGAGDFNAQDVFHSGFSTPFQASPVGDGTYGLSLNSGGSPGIGRLENRSPVGSNQWGRFIVVADGNNPNGNYWFGLIQHQTYIPGAADGQCAALGLNEDCYDTVSYYIGVESLALRAAISGREYPCTGGSKDEYKCTPFLHITKSTPQAIAKVITVAGTFYTPRKGDEIYVDYVGSRLRVACKGHGAEASRTPSTAYSVGQFIQDSYGNLQIVKTAGTSGSGSAPFPSSPAYNHVTGGDTTVDGGVTWEYFGQPCPTTDKFTAVIDTVDTDLTGEPGFPGLMISGNSSYVAFKNWTGGTADAGTGCALDSNLCGSAAKANQWILW